MLNPIDVNGETPILAGLRCEELIVSEFWYKGILAEPANVIHLKFEAQWHRLYFDYPVIFWRLDYDAPEPIVAHSQDLAYPLTDLGRKLGIRGVVLDGLVAAPVDNGLEVRLEFRNGTTLQFTNVADRTSYRAFSKAMELCSPTSAAPDTPAARG